MRTIHSTILLLGLLVLLTAAPAGAAPDDKPGGKDLPMITRYPGSVIDDFARARHIAGLEGRRRVRHVEVAIDPKLVKRAGPRIRDGDIVPATGQLLHRIRGAEQELDAPRRRSP